jgi:hypothetical protein
MLSAGIQADAKEYIDKYPPEADGVLQQQQQRQQKLPQQLAPYQFKVSRPTTGNIMPPSEGGGVQTGVHQGIKGGALVAAEHLRPQRLR